MNTSEELKARAAEIRDAEQAGENTAQRVGSLLCDLVDLLVGEEAVITATQKLVSRGDVEAAGKVTAGSLEATTSELGNASAGVLNLLAAGRAAIYIQQLGTLLHIYDLNTGKRVFIPTDKNGVVAMVGDTATKGEAAALAARLVPLEGSGTARVEPSGGTFFRHGAVCTDNWCERYASSALPQLTVETADAARKFNLRDSVDAGVYIASGSGQRWNIRVPAGYVIRSYRIVAQLRAGQQEGTVFLTPEGGDTYSVISASETTVNATVGAQSTYFTTEDVSTEPLDRQVWLKSFEVVVERTSPYALQCGVDAALQTAKDYADVVDAVTNSRIDALGSVYKAKGSSAWTVADSTSPLMLSTPGDVWNITESFTLGGKTYPAGTNVVCVASSMSTPDYNNRFDALAGEIDLSGFYTKTEVDARLGGKQDIIDDLANIRSGASEGATAVQPEGMSEAIGEVVQGLENGDIVSQYAKTLEDWADQKAIATPDTYTDAVRTTGGDIPIETSAGSKLESIKPVAGSKWTAKLLFNGSYNMLNAAKWGAANSQPYVGGVGSDFVYFLVPELTLGTFGTADENNGLLFTDSDGDNVQPASVYFKPLGSTIPQSLTDGTLITPTNVSYDGKTYKDYATDGAGWLIVPKTIFDNDVCAHIAWEDWYDKYVSLDEPTTNPEAVVGILMLEGLLALAHTDKYLRGINDEVCDNVEFGDTGATITHMVDELSVAANAWTNAATGESDSQGNALYRHSATVSAIKQGGAACIEGEDGGIPLTVNGTTISYIDTNAAAPASTVFYEVTSESTTKAYTDSIFDGSNINAETGILPINDCSIEAQVAIDGEANITVKYAKNIVDQVAINATVDVPQIKKQVGEHEERIVELEDTAVRTGSYDATVAVGLADNFKGDTIVDAEFYKRKTGGTQSVGSGIAAIKEVRGKSIVWNQLVNTDTTEVATISGHKYLTKINDVKSIITSTGAAIAINDASVDQVFDLTLMFGAGNVPATVAEFEKMFPLAHYDYNAGEVIPFAGQNLVTIGKNQYNPASGKAYLLGGQTYQLLGAYTSATIDGVEVTLDGNNCFTITKDCVLEITGSNDTDTFVGLYDGETNTYEPYERHTLPLDPSQWRDKQGNLVFPYGGMHGVGTAYDYAKVDADGYIRKAVRCFEKERFGSFTNWAKTYYGFSAQLRGIASGRYQNSICEIYSYGNFRQTSMTYGLATSVGTFIGVNDPNYSDVKSYREATQNAELIYELAEPVEVELATPIYAKYLVDKDGTEEITPANGTTPYTAPANLSILYAMDARGEIKNLPKGYLSKESAENMLNAMKSAGVISDYTMTYSNGQYIFTFVKAE